MKGYDEETDESYEIHDLLSENERLKGEISDRQETEESLTKWVAELGDEVDRLKGEVVALKDSVKKMLHSDTPTRWDAVGYAVARSEVERLLGDHQISG